MKQPKKAISLFAGIEGFGLAIHKMGWEVVASVEWEQFPQLVIKKNFPKTEIHGDIKEFDGTKFRGTIDIVCGGFPCQPYSLAGKRKGKDDDRHLWPEMLRVIREVQPTWVIGENVPGLVNWSEGVVFEEVQSDLEAEGYEVQSFVYTSSCRCRCPAPKRQGVDCCLLRCAWTRIAEIWRRSICEGKRRKRKR